MYSNLLINLFNSKCDDNYEINAAQTQDVMYKIGLPFNRAAMIRLHKADLFGNDIKVTESERQKRVTITLAGLVKVIAFYLTGAAFPGYRRTNKLIELLDGSDLKVPEVKVNGQSLLVEDLVKNYDRDCFECNIESDSYNPNDWENGQFSLHTKAGLVHEFLHYWLLGRDDYTEDNFYKSWELVRDRVLGVEGQLMLYNQYQQDRVWISQPLLGVENGGVGLANSILNLEHFIKTASEEDVRKLQCWFEIIMTFENGSGFIAGEAKAALKSLPTLNQNGLMDDWYLLAYIYMYSMNPIKFKYGVGEN